MTRDPVIAWERLIDAFVAALPDQQVERWQYLDSLALLAQQMRLPRVHTDDEVIELIADAMHWRVLPEDEVPEAVPDIEGDPAPTLIENILADDPSDVHQAVREHFHRNRVPIPDDATINKMLERHARKHVQPTRQLVQRSTCDGEQEPLPLFAWGRAP